MSWIGETLWDFLRPRRQSSRDRATNSAMARSRVSAPGRINTIRLAKPKSSMQLRYDALVEEMKRLHGIRVRKWRKSSSGVAWAVRYADGKVVKLIESPYPRGPMSCAIFLHEVGHHAIGLGVYKPRCLEEYRVWQWAIEEMRARGFNVTEAVLRRVDRSMRYAVGKAKRRGIQSVPAELQAYV